MIYEIAGLPRAGKTTALTMIGLRSLQGKSTCGIAPHKKVFSTFYCKGLYQLDVNDLKSYDFSDSLVLIDEISLYFDNRDYKNFDKEFIYFFKLHGHYKIDLVWASQHFADADKKIRDVTDTIFLCEPSFFGLSVLKKILHTYNIENLTDKYRVCPRNQWKYFRRSKYYDYFDSYEKKEKLVLTEEKLKKWGE